MRSKTAPSPSLPEWSLPPASSLGILRGLLMLAIILAYANSFYGDFVFDDRLTLIESTDLYDITDPYAIFVGREFGLPVRPFPYLTFALNYALDGLNPRFYHLVNLLIHIGCSLFAFDIARWTLASPHLEATFRNSATAIAWCAVLLWSVHPLQTMAITYVYQRMESLMVLCYQATWWSFLQACQSEKRSHHWLFLSIFCCFLGMASKEVMITAPLLILWYDRVFVSSSWQSLWQKRAWYYASLAATSAVLFLAMYSQRGRYSEFSGARHSGLIYLLNQPRVLLLYAKLLIWPSPQCIDYNWPMSYSASDIIPALLPITLIVGLILRNLVRYPKFAFAFGSVFLVLSVTSSIVAVQDLVMEHRMYLPSLLLITASLATFAWLGSKFLSRQQVSPSTEHHATWPKAAVIACVLLAIPLGICTHFRNRDYADYETMWTQVLQVVPLSRRARTKWVATLAKEKKLDQLLAESKALLKQYPQEPVALLTLAEAHQVRHEPEEVIPLAKRALGSTEYQDEAHYLLASSYSALKQSDLAIEHYQQALGLNPIFLRAWHGLGRELALREQLDDAIACFRKAIAVNRTRSDALQDLALALDLQGKPAEAESLFVEYLQINPQHVSARTNYADLLRRQDKFSQAAEQLKLALQQNPDTASLWAQLASLHIQLQQLPQARQAIQQAQKFSQDPSPENAETWVYLSGLYLQLSEPQAAQKLLEKSLEEPSLSAEAARRLIALRLDRKHAATFAPDWVVNQLSPQKKTPPLPLPLPEACFWLATAQLELDQPTAATQIAEKGLREVQLPQDQLWRLRLERLLLTAKQRLASEPPTPAKS